MFRESSSSLLVASRSNRGGRRAPIPNPSILVTCSGSKEKSYSKSPQPGMAASLIICRYFSFLLAIFFLFFVSFCYPMSPSFSFSIGRFHESNYISDSEISLSGNAHVTSDGSFIQMTGARIMYGKPIKFQGQKPAFSTNFTFSFPSPSHNLVFFVTPYPSPSPSHVPDGPMDGRNRDALFLLTALTITFQMVPLESKPQYHVQIVLASEAYTESTNFSFVNLILDDVGEKLQSWIDYDGDSKRVQVWVAKSGELRPLNSSVSSCPIGLSDMLQRDAMYVGIDNNINSSSGGFALPTCLYSWSFTSKNGAPYMMHSEPLNPQSMLMRSKDENGNRTFSQLRGTTSKWRLVTAVVFSFAFGSLVMLTLMLIRSAIVDKRQVAPLEDVVHSVEFGYEKVLVLQDAKGVKGGGEASQ